MITFTILATTFTVSILTLFLLGIAFLVVLVAIIRWVNSALDRNAIAQAQEIFKSNIIKTAVESRNTPPHQAWLATLIENDYIDLLYGAGMHIILGTPEMGTTSIFRHVFTKVNSSFLQDATLCAYVDVKQTAKSSRTIGYISIDEVYRSIIWSSVQYSINLLQSKMNARHFHRTGLTKKQKELNGILNAGLTRLSPKVVKQTLFQIWQLIGVKQVVFLVENLTAIDPNSVPALLGYLMRTFGHTPSVSFIVSGDPATLILNKSTEDGYVGIQLMHDARIDIDLPNLLTPHDGINRQDSAIRLGYLEKLVHLIQPNSNLRNMESNMFSPQDLWQSVFDVCEGNLDEISISFEKLFSYFNSTGKKITVKTMHNLLSIDARELDEIKGVKNDG